MNDLNLMASITATERKEVRREVKAEAAQNKKAQNSHAKASAEVWHILPRENKQLRRKSF